MPSVVLLHGNGGDRASCLPRAELLAGAGYSVLPVTLRAHGDSTGDFNDLGYSARHDVVAAVEFLERRRPGRPIFILGRLARRRGGDVRLGRPGTVGSPAISWRPPTSTSGRPSGTGPSNALPLGLEWVAYQGLLIVSPLVLPDLDKISPREAIGGRPRRTSRSC